MDADNLIATHDFVNGFMNPLLSSSTLGSLISGTVLGTSKNIRNLYLIARLSLEPELLKY
jgi:hypothetical protein